MREIAELACDAIGQSKMVSTHENELAEALGQLRKDYGGDAYVAIFVDECESRLNLNAK